MLRQDFSIFQIGTRSGVQLEVGASLVLLAVVMVRMFAGPVVLLHDLAIFIVILASLHMREMARAWMVQRLGLTLHSIVLSGSGGRTVHNQGRAEQEELVAAMGPISSLALWAVASLVVLAFPAESMASYWLQIFAFVNLFIAIFTALPVMPLDGGRFLYLFLGRTFGPETANRVIGGFGLVLSAIWLPASLLAFLIFGMVLIALPSVQEHWDMLKGGNPVQD